MTKWIFNRNGRATALDGGDAVYDSHGNLCFWVSDNNLYNRDGDHVGWTEGGVYYDSGNDVIGFVRDHTQHLPFNPGIGGTPGIPLFLHRPGKPGFSGIPGRPGYGGWSDTLLEDYIEDNGEIMTQDERWMMKYKEVVEFIESNRRNPSKHRIEEHDHLNWLKAHRKALNAGRMKQERIEKFRKLLEMTEQYKRKNQYE